MTFLDALLSAVQALRANVLRSALTMLGIVIGVAAVILVVAIGSGARDVIVRQISSLGSNLIVIDPLSVPIGSMRGIGGNGRSLSEDDADAIRRDVPDIQDAVPMVRGSVLAVRGDLNVVTPIYGVTLGFLDARDWEIANGRSFANDEMNAGDKVALIGKTVARALFGEIDPVGAAIRIQRVPFTVVGVLAAKGQTTSGKDQDDVIIAPLKTVKARVLGVNPAAPQRVDSMLVKVSEGADLSVTEEEVRGLLRERHRLQTFQEDDFSIKNLAEVLQIKQASAQALASLVAAVASVSLLVGGIGIMNIMLVSVIERTREIGIRMAVGARRRDILAQFLVEAVSVSAIGGGVGLIIGIVAAGVVASIAGWPWIISPVAVLLAVGFSVGVGVVFGFYPARRAAWLDPIEALRHE
ncbi:MAG: ABC transporter permease [Rhodospirillales bacterium]|nr:ABC transporter permease [Rhodospirillales bacterium]